MYAIFHFISYYVLLNNDYRLGSAVMQNTIISLVFLWGAIWTAVDELKEKK